MMKMNSSSSLADAIAAGQYVQSASLLRSALNGMKTPSVERDMCIHNLLLCDLETKALSVSSVISKIDTELLNSTYSISNNNRVPFQCNNEGYVWLLRQMNMCRLKASQEPCDISDILSHLTNIIRYICDINTTSDIVADLLLFARKFNGDIHCLLLDLLYLYIVLKMQTRIKLHDILGSSTTSWLVSIDHEDSSRWRYLQGLLVVRDGGDTVWVDKEIVRKEYEKEKPFLPLIYLLSCCLFHHRRNMDVLRLCLRCCMINHYQEEQIRWMQSIIWNTQGDHFRVVHLLEAIYTTIQNNTNDNSDKWVTSLCGCELAWAYFKTMNYDKSLILLQYIELHSHQAALPRVWRLLGLVYYTKLDYKTACEYYNKLISNKNNCLRPYQELSKDTAPLIFFFADDQEHKEMYCFYSYNACQIIREYSECLLKIDRFNECIQMLQSFLGSSSQSTDPYLHILFYSSGAYIHNGDYEEGLKTINTCIIEDQNIDSMKSNKRKLDSTRKNDRDHRESLSLRICLHHQRGVLLVLLKQQNSALEAFLMATKCSETYLKKYIEKDDEMPYFILNSWFNLTLLRMKAGLKPLACFNWLKFRCYSVNSKSEYYQEKYNMIINELEKIKNEQPFEYIIYDIHPVQLLQLDKVCLSHWLNLSKSNYFTNQLRKLTN